MTGFVPCFFSHDRIFALSKIVPSDVHTGFVNGCKETAQKLNGRRLKGALKFSPLKVPDPALAE